MTPARREKFADVSTSQAHRTQVVRVALAWHFSPVGRGRVFLVSASRLVVGSQASQCAGAVLSSRFAGSFADLRRIALLPDDPAVDGACSRPGLDGDIATDCIPTWGVRRGYPKCGQETRPCLMSSRTWFFIARPGITACIDTLAVVQIAGSHRDVVGRGRHAGTSLVQLVKNFGRHLLR